MKKKIKKQILRLLFHLCFFFLENSVENRSWAKTIQQNVRNRFARNTAACNSQIDTSSQRSIFYSIAMAGLPPKPKQEERWPNNMKPKNEKDPKRRKAGVINCRSCYEEGFEMFISFKCHKHGIDVEKITLNDLYNSYARLIFSKL